MPDTSRRYSLRQDLKLLVLACVLPAAGVSMALAYSAFILQRDQVEQQTAFLAQTLLADLDREMAGVESALKTLATANELTTGDLRGFHRRARDALFSGMVYNFILTDVQGHQVLNTLRPYGSPLPTSGTPPHMGRVFAEKATVLSDLFMAPVAQKPGIAMGVPVVKGEQVVFSLNAGIDPVHINALLARRPLPESWLAAVIDSRGTLVGRSRDPDRFVGTQVMPEIWAAVVATGNGRVETLTRDGMAVILAHATSQPWRWSILVAAPKHTLYSAIAQQLSLVLLGTLVAFGLGLWLARGISLRVLGAVRELNNAAISLGNGDDVKRLSIQWQEAQAVGTAMQQASVAMKKVKFLAQHDALTELPNRLLFDEVAERKLVLAERKGQTLAVLALDLDGFKAVNDTQGHGAGDEVLKRVARRIEETIRASDIAARIGGDEFIILLAEVSPESAMETAERIVAGLSEPYPGIGLRVSASVGLALYPQCGNTLKALTSCADQALYQAKARGKDRAVMLPASDLSTG